MEGILQVYGGYVAGIKKRPGGPGTLYTFVLNYLTGVTGSSFPVLISEQRLPVCQLPGRL